MQMIMIIKNAIDEIVLCFKVRIKTKLNAYQQAMGILFWNSEVDIVSKPACKSVRQSFCKVWASLRQGACLR